MKIVHIETLLFCGQYSKSAHWRKTRRAIHKAVRRCAWPPRSKKFTIYPESGKGRGKGNGVIPIRTEFIKHLRALEWTIEGPAKNHLGEHLGEFDAVLLGPRGPVVVEWGNGKHLLKPSIDEQANDADFKWHTRRRCTGCSFS